MKNIFRVKLDICDIGDFINTANSISNNVVLYQGQTTASGKSIIGIYSLNLNSTVNMIVYDRVNDNIVYEKFGKWLVDGEESL